MKSKKIRVKDSKGYGEVTYDDNWLITGTFIMLDKFVSTCIQDTEIVSRIAYGDNSNFQLSIQSLVPNERINKPRYEAIINPKKDELVSFTKTNIMWNTDKTLSRLFISKDNDYLWLDSKYDILLEKADTYLSTKGNCNPVYLYSDNELLGVVMPIKVDIGNLAIINTL